MSTPPDILAAPWRTGRRNGHTIYAQLGPEPSDSDPFVGSLNTPEAAAEAVRAHNADRDAEAASDAEYCSGVRDGVKAERERIAEEAPKMASVLSRPGLGNGPSHGDQVRMVRLDDLLDLLNDDSEDGGPT